MRNPRKLVSRASKSTIRPKLSYSAKSGGPLFPARAEAYQQDMLLVDALCDIDHGLTDWEVRYVEDMASWVHDRGRVLLPGQRAKLEEILEDRG